MKSSQSGFVVIVTMLVMAGLIGLGLSVANQSTEDVAESGSDSESVRVFNAAEAGVEEILAEPSNFTASSIDLGSPTTGINNSDIRYSVTPNTTLKTYLLQGGTATLDLPSGYNNNLTVQWDTDGGGAGCDDAALLIALYYDDGAVRYDGVHNTACTTTVSGFASAVVGTSGSGYTNKYVFTPPANLKMARFKSLLADTTLEITGTGMTDPQYHVVRSEATSGSDGVTRTIEVAKTIEVPPAILDYAVYSGASITK